MVKGEPKRPKVENKKAMLERIYGKNSIISAVIYLRAEIKELAIGIEKRATEAGNTNSEIKISRERRYLEVVRPKYYLNDRKIHHHNQVNPRAHRQANRLTPLAPIIL